MTLNTFISLGPSSVFLGKFKLQKQMLQIKEFDAKQKISQHKILSKIKIKFYECKCKRGA
jgi:hypothetical protein